MAKMMWNFGRVVIGGFDGASDLSFDIGEAFGVILFTPNKRDSFMSDSGDINEATDKNRVYMSIDFTNMCDDTADKLSTLMQWLNNSQAGSTGVIDLPLTIYPRLSDDLLFDENYSYDCLLTGDVSFIDLAMLPVGQTMNLKFKSKGLHPLLTTSTPEFTVWEVNNSGTIETLQFNDDGTLVDAKFKIN